MTERGTRQTAIPHTSAGDGVVLPPWLVLAVAVTAMSWAGPLVRFTDAPALAVATWRLVFSMGFIAIVLLVRRGAWQRVDLSRTEWALAVLSGLLLAGHFWSWIASLSLTSVSSSVALVSTQPIFVALLSATLLGERPTLRQWVGIVVAVAGAFVIAWGGFGRGAAPLLGDLLAVLGAILVSGYYVIGRRLRQRMDLWTYIGIVYGIAAAALMLVLLSGGWEAAFHHQGRDWLVFLALAAGPMMLGHTGVNYALRHVRAYIANLALLGEPVGATLIALLLPAIAEVPPVQTVIGGILIIGGIAAGVLGGRTR